MNYKDIKVSCEATDYGLNLHGRLRLDAEIKVFSNNSFAKNQEYGEEEIRRQICRKIYGDVQSDAVKAYAVIQVLASKADNFQKEDYEKIHELMQPLINAGNELYQKP